ncbi:DUF3168 domain-containing protein [Leifsonia poae]|uniref:DUF3168 domain-containing protein n=1 Tax=Leifsonia poae TaxID=110933 RepID=UPI001CBC981B|nr:DUF3168 domain-containing protein [Leifsonia poae]
MIRAHVNAILARLREDTVLQGFTFEGVVLPDVQENRPQRYCTIFTNSGYRTVERLSGPSATATFTYTIHSVGTDPQQAQAVAERVFAQLLDYTPTVVGRQCGRLRHAASQPVQVDTDVKPPLYYCVDQFDLTSDPI